MRYCQSHIRSTKVRTKKENFASTVSFYYTNNALQLPKQFGRRCVERRVDIWHAYERVCYERCHVTFWHDGPLQLQSLHDETDRVGLWDNDPSTQINDVSRTQSVLTASLTKRESLIFLIQYPSKCFILSPKPGNAMEYVLLSGSQAIRMQFPFKSQMFQMHMKCKNVTHVIWIEVNTKLPGEPHWSRGRKQCSRNFTGTTGGCERKRHWVLSCELLFTVKGINDETIVSLPIVQYIDKKSKNHELAKSTHTQWSHYNTEQTVKLVYIVLT